jgi:hypothetical protein
MNVRRGKLRAQRDSSQRKSGQSTKQGRESESHRRLQTTLIE